MAGLGALVLRKASAVVLHKVYFGGGAVDDATAEVRSSAADVGISRFLIIVDCLAFFSPSLGQWMMFGAAVRSG